MSSHLGEFGGWLFWGYVIIRAAFTPFLLLLLILFVVGSVYGWQWVKNPWLRLGHLSLCLLLVLDILNEYSINFGVYLMYQSTDVLGWDPLLAHWLVFYDLSESMWIIISLGLTAIAGFLLFLIPPWQRTDTKV